LQVFDTELSHFLQILTRLLYIKPPPIKEFGVVQRGLSIVPCGHWIIMDNASFHRKKKLQAIAERYGVNLLFLPAYSPDFNPIEKFWANMKKWLRKNIASFIDLRSAILYRLVRFLF
jgi:hypothetical protein